MKKIIKASKFIGVLSFAILAFTACENEYNSLESDIQGIQNFGTNSETFPVVAYTKRVKPVQANNFPSNFIGIYSDPVFGNTTNNVLTQVVPTNTYFDPDFGTNPEITNVYLSIPYFSNQTEESTDDEPEYKLDSLFGNTPVKLSIYRSNYFLRDYNPETEEVNSQVYYSNNSEFGTISNQGELLYYNPQFIPSEAEQIVYEEDEEGVLEEVEKIAPSLHVSLLNDNDFWKNLLIDKQGMPELSNPNNFKDYFRGLYFKIEPSDGNTEGNAIMLDFDNTNANLTVYYNNETEVENDEGVLVTEIVRNNKFIMNFAGNRANTITVDAATEALLNNADTNADTVDGDEKLYLKGGEGSIAIINLFDDQATLDEFNLLYRDADGKPSRLINEANLNIYVEQDDLINMSETQEPNRLMLFDIKNNIPVADFYFDLLADVSNPVESKLTFSSKLERDGSGNGVKYKIQLTEHLNNILLKDSTNYQLGLYVTTNINDLTNSSVLNGGDLKGMPVGSVLSQKGTILHGSNLNVPEEKRLELEIYYTEPDN